MKCLSQTHFKFNKKEKKWHTAPKVYTVVEKADEEDAVMQEGHSL